MKRGKRAFTLTEMLTVMVILIMISIILHSVFRQVYSYYDILTSHPDVNRQTRAVAAIMGKDIRNASYVFSGQSATIEDMCFSVPPVDGPGGSEILLALPDFNRETGEIPSYTVVGYYLQKDTSDPTSKNRYKLMRYSASGIVPAAAHDPDTIDLSTVRGGITRVCARFLLQSDYLLSIENSGKSVNLVMTVEKQRINCSAPARSQLRFAMNLRNT